jgi:hypothetical protein
MCEAIVAVKPDLVITEKGVSGMLHSSHPNIDANIYKILHNITS